MKLADLMQTLKGLTKDLRDMNKALVAVAKELVGAINWLADELKRMNDNDS